MYEEMRECDSRLSNVYKNKVASIKRLLGSYYLVGYGISNYSCISINALNWYVFHD